MGRPIVSIIPQTRPPHPVPLSKHENSNQAENDDDWDGKTPINTTPQLSSFSDDFEAALFRATTKSSLDLFGFHPKMSEKADIKETGSFPYSPSEPLDYQVPTTPSPRKPWWTQWIVEILLSTCSFAAFVSKCPL